MFKLIYGGLFIRDGGDVDGNEIEEQIEMSGLLRYRCNGSSDIEEPLKVA